MIKRIIIMVSLLCVLAMGNVAEAPKSPLEVASNNVVQITYSYSVKTIYGTTCDGANKGSGVLLGYDMVLTCYHIFDENPPGIIKITYIENEKTQIREGGQVDILKYDLEKDLLLLQITPGFIHRLTFIASTMPNTGDDMAIIGHPGVRFNPLRFYKFSVNQYGIMVFPVYSGDSGGGVFNMNGELIGIVKLVMYLREPTTQITFVGYAIPLNTIRDFLRWDKVNNPTGIVR